MKRILIAILGKIQLKSSHVIVFDFYNTETTSTKFCKNGLMLNDKEIKQVDDFGYLQWLPVKVI